eukprot:633293-Pleurochrysis_carterae.AAC.2
MNLQSTGEDDRFPVSFRKCTKLARLACAATAAHALTPSPSTQDFQTRHQILPAIGCIVEINTYGVDKCGSPPRTSGAYNDCVP